MTIQPGEFWVADIRFTNATGSKKRPVLVMWLDGSDLVAAAVTPARPRSPMDVALTDWIGPGGRFPRIPTGFNLSAQGCESASYPGFKRQENSSTLKGLLRLGGTRTQGRSPSRPTLG